MTVLCRKTLQEGTMKSSSLAMIGKGRKQHVIKPCVESNYIICLILSSERILRKLF